jgi:hypothetical protein
MSRLDTAIVAAEAAARTDTLRTRLRLERVMYDHLRAFVALENAKAAGAFATAAKHAGRLVASQKEMNKLTPFMGWHPYKVYACDWERERMEGLAALVDDPAGQLVALLPEQAAFRTDPFDDGRFERWQAPTVDLAGWSTIDTTLGWDTQGLHDEHGRPYRGAAWYAFDVDIPASAAGKAMFLHAPAVVNEVWVWINGRYAGHRPYKMPWFRPHSAEFEVTDLIEPGTRHRIAMRVLCNFDVWGANGIYERLFIYSKNAAAALPDSDR